MSAISVTSPAPYQTFQRGPAQPGGLLADITIAGTYTFAAACHIETSWNGGAFVTIATLGSGTGAPFSGTLPQQGGGQGTLTVRIAEDHTATVTVAFVGVGEVFCCSGQSNMSGRATNNQVYASPPSGIKATLFGNDYVWKELVDPYDDATNQVDTVSADLAGSANNNGSMIPRFATLALAALNVPVAFIPCALGGSRWNNWETNSGDDNRNFLFGSMHHRVGVVGGCRAILWWLGETDSEIGTPQSEIVTEIEAVIDLMYSYFSCKSIITKIQQTGFAGDATVNAAIGQAWAQDANAPPGPDLSDFNVGIHLFSDADISTAGTRFWTAVQAAFFPQLPGGSAVHSMMAS